MAFVRWFESAERPAHDVNIRLIPFQFTKTRLPGIQGKVLHKCVVSLVCIIGPCFMQPDPINSHIFHSNHWVGNTANDIGLPGCCPTHCDRKHQRSVVQ